MIEPEATDVFEASGPVVPNLSAMSADRVTIIERLLDQLPIQPAWFTVERDGAGGVVLKSAEAPLRVDLHPPTHLEIT